MNVIDMKTLDLKGKRVLIRVDYNVPIEHEKVVSDARIRATLPTILAAQKAGAAVMLMSHLGRPEEGQFDRAYSLEPVAIHLGHLLHQPVRLVTHWLEGVHVEPGEVVLCENVRFNVGENDNYEALSKKMAALCDVFVMDAFGTAHRKQASTYGVAQYAPIACAGPLLLAELDAISKVLENPKRPLVAIVGGSKVSGKLKLLQALSQKVDQLIVGGGIANTFLAAAGQPIGASLYEPDLIGQANNIMSQIRGEGGFIPLPVDVKVATTFDASAKAVLKNSAEVGINDLILDIGPESVRELQAIIAKAGTILWNGPLGVFEFDAFEEGTKLVAEAIAHSDAFSVAGGGDTLAAIEKYHLEKDISYISTGGGAFLTMIEGSPLPGVEILKTRAK